MLVIVPPFQIAPPLDEAWQLVKVAEVMLYVPI
jgi:hypothetical protein